MIKVVMISVDRYRWLQKFKINETGINGLVLAMLKHIDTTIEDVEVSVVDQLVDFDFKKPDMFLRVDVDERIYYLANEQVTWKEMFDKIIPEELEQQDLDVGSEDEQIYKAQLKAMAAHFSTEELFEEPIHIDHFFND